MTLSQTHPSPSVQDPQLRLSQHGADQRAGVRLGQCWPAISALPHLQGPQMPFVFIAFLGTMHIWTHQCIGNLGEVHLPQILVYLALPSPSFPRFHLHWSSVTLLHFEKCLSAYGILSTDQETPQLGSVPFVLISMTRGILLYTFPSQLFQMTSAGIIIILPGRLSY